MMYHATARAGAIGGGKPSAIATNAAIVFGAFSVLLLGVVTALGDPVIIGAGVGLLASLLLLASPQLTVWLILAPGLLVAGVIPIWAEEMAGKATWGVSLLGLVLLCSALYRVLTDRSARNHTPAYVWLAFGFLLYVVLNGVLQCSSVYEFAGGFKRYFQAFGLLFAFAWLVIDERAVRRYLLFFLIVALIQLPWAVYELLRLVPVREALKTFYPSLVPVDVVAGTFGASLYTGGANGEMATYLLVVLAFVIVRWRARLIRGRWVLCIVPVLLTPLFMGETKIIVVLLPFLCLMLFYRDLLHKPIAALFGIAAGIAVTAAVTAVYLHTTNANSLEGLVADTLNYNVYEGGHGGYALNRTRALTFWASQQQDPVSLLFGEGVGSVHERSGGHVSLKYVGYGVGLTAAATLLWEQGVVGTALFAMAVLLAWRAAGRLRRSASVEWIRADATAIHAVLPLFGVYLGYRVALLEALPFQIVFATLLGYLAWLHRLSAKTPVVSAQSRR
jgi:hypothetical protein